MREGSSQKPANGISAALRLRHWFFECRCPRCEAEGRAFRSRQCFEPLDTPGHIHDALNFASKSKVLFNESITLCGCAFSSVFVCF